MLMRISDWLKSGTQKLIQTGVGTARLDTLILLEDVTGRDRAWLLAHPESEISSAQLARLDKLLERRASHEPLAYIRGRTEFYGREFIITPAVLEPRPESEAMIDLLKEIADLPAVVQIADVGAGSGALGITAALEVPNARVELLELDSEALKVAKANVDKFTLQIDTTSSDLLSRSGCNYDLLLCNLPYVPDDFHINLAASHEPHLAIFGGPDGMDIYRRLFLQLKNMNIRPLYILCEALPPQHPKLQQIALERGYMLRKSQDFIQLFIRKNS
jgi:release factor glutamine methyltransferase